MIGSSNGRQGKGILVAGAALLMSAGTEAAGFQAWTDSADVYMDTSPSGAGMMTTITDFPLLIRLESPEFSFHRARGAGEDLRFATLAGTPLPHHVEHWDAASGRAAVWVLVDTVHADNSTQRIRMYWGNSAAADVSSPSAVFPASKGLLGVWHLGAGGTAARPNAVSASNAAMPVNYDGDETRPGIIGLCDSLDGGATGDYLDLGAGFSDFSGGFSWSAWIMPTAVKRWSRLLDLSNGPGADNIVMGRENLTSHLFTNFPHQGGGQTRLQADGAFTENQWQFFAVTISTDRTVRIFKNGALIGTTTMAAPISNNQRANNWIGRSAWSADEFFQGMMDEVRVSSVPLGGAWFKLSYETQRPDQRTVSLNPPSRCQSSFAVPADTVIREGSSLALTARADCAETYEWNSVSGPAPRILDPNVKSLHVGAPRVAGDAAIVFKFTATFGDTVKEKLVTVNVTEAIPEPALDLPRTLVWDGKDSLGVTAIVTNLAAIRASPDSNIAWRWEVSGVSVDTAVRPGALVLKGPAAPGSGAVKLCLSNNGPATCRTSALIIGAPTTLGVVRPEPGFDGGAATAPRRDARGRLHREGPGLFWKVPAPR
jgi:hypothetical protein